MSNSGIREASILGWRGLIHEYKAYLPVTPGAKVITLGEGGTPLVYAKHLSELKSAHVYLKIEGANPTGSFKDRGMTLAITKAIESGSQAVVCASTGNTSASAAAYAAAAGVNCIVLIPAGFIALGKLAQALIYGAKVVQIRGNFDRALEIVREMGEKRAVTVVNSINPYRIQGQKTGAFEVVDQLGFAPDYHFIPVGNAGNITAYWMGYTEYHEAQRCATLPKMIGVQAQGAAPIVLGHIVADPETVATAIRIGNPASWSGALAAKNESGGDIFSVTDTEILAAYKLLARRESIFCEPASASSVAGLLKTPVEADSTVVCVLTGHGLKDPDTAISQIEVPNAVDATLDAISEAILF